MSFFTLDTFQQYHEEVEAEMKSKIESSPESPSTSTKSNGKKLQEKRPSSPSRAATTRPLSAQAASELDPLSALNLARAADPWLGNSLLTPTACSFLDFFLLCRLPNIFKIVLDALTNPAITQYCSRKRRCRSEYLTPIREFAANMTRLMWLQLVDVEGDEVGLAHRVKELSDEDLVADLQYALKVMFSDDIFADTAPSDIIIFANWEAYDEKYHPLKPSSSLRGLGKDDIDNPIIVQVPEDGIFHWLRQGVSSSLSFLASYLKPSDKIHAPKKDV